MLTLEVPRSRSPKTMTSFCITLNSWCYTDLQNYWLGTMRAKTNMRAGIHIFSGIAFLCLLASCATPQNARDKGAVTSCSSTKSAKEITACVATAWESAYGITNPVNVWPTTEGFTLQISNGQRNTFVVLDVADNERGSMSTYYKGYVLLEGMWDKAVKECNDAQPGVLADRP